MNPDNEKSVPVNYLDQIATKPSKRNLFKGDKKMLVLAGLGIIAVVVFVIAAIYAAGAGNSDSTLQLAARLNSVSSTANSANGKLKSSALRAANSELKLYLDNTLRDFKPILTSKNVDINKLDSKYTVPESNTALLARLEDARLNAVYDRTYAREMAALLEKTILLTQDALHQTSDSKTRVFLTNAKDSLVKIQEEFDSFSS